MQSGFGENFLFWSSEFQENRRRISQRILMANFDCKIVGLVFLGLQATQKIHALNSRPELSAFLSNFTFLNPKFIHGDFLLTGRPTFFPVSTMAAGNWEDNNTKNYEQWSKKSPVAIGGDSLWIDRD